MKTPSVESLEPMYSNMTGIAGSALLAPQLCLERAAIELVILVTA